MKILRKEDRQEENTDKANQLGLDPIILPKRTYEVLHCTIAYKKWMHFSQIFAACEQGCSGKITETYRKAVAKCWSREVCWREVGKEVKFVGPKIYFM